MQHAAAAGQGWDSGQSPTRLESPAQGNLVIQSIVQCCIKRECQVLYALFSLMHSCRVHHHVCLYGAVLAKMRNKHPSITPENLLCIRYVLGILHVLHIPHVELPVTDFLSCQYVAFRGLI